jgi:hypothetical protein
MAVGTLELLWHVANETGNPIMGDADDIEAVADWRGARGELVAALLECGSNGGAGFVFKREDGCFEIHDYWHHAPDYVRKRARREEERQKAGDQLRKPDRSKQTLPSTDDQTVTGQNGVGSPENGDFFHTPAPAPAPAPARKEGEGGTAATPRLKAVRKPEVFLPADFRLDDELRKYVMQQIPDCDIDAWFEDYCLMAKNKQWKYADWRLAVMRSARDSRADSGHWLAGRYPKRPNGGSESDLFRGAI